MSNDRLSLLKLFTRVADTGSLTRAARELEISVPTASRRLRDLESLLAIQLFDRDTHVLRVTPAGKDFRTGAQELLGQWDRLLDTAAIGRCRPTRLTVIAPIGLGQGVVLSSLAAFAERHPQVSLNWTCLDGDVAMLATEADLWIALGEPVHESLVYRTAGAAVLSLVAAPRFADQHRLDEPGDLDRCPGLVSQGWTGTTMVLSDDEGHSHALRMPPRFRSNSPFAVRQAALQAMGWAVIPRFLIEADLSSGSLVETMLPWRVASTRISVVSVQTRYRSEMVGELVEVLLAGLRNQLTPPPAGQRPT